MAAQPIGSDSHPCFWTREELNNWYINRMKGYVRKLPDLNYQRWNEIKFTTRAFHYGTKFLEHWAYIYDYGTPRLNPQWSNSSPTIAIYMSIVNDKKNKFQALYDWTKEEIRHFGFQREDAVKSGPEGYLSKEGEKLQKDMQAQSKMNYSLNSSMSDEGKKTLINVYISILQVKDKEMAKLLRDLFTQETVIEDRPWPIPDKKDYMYLKPEDLKNLD